MKYSKILFLIICIFITHFLYANESNNSGFISIYSEPTDATVYINGELIGKTPIEKFKKGVGVYQVTVIKEGYETWAKYIEILKNKHLKLKPKLEKVERWIIKSGVGLYFAYLPLELNTLDEADNNKIDEEQRHFGEVQVIIENIKPNYNILINILESEVVNYLEYIERYPNGCPKLYLWGHRMRIISKGITCTYNIFKKKLLNLYVGIGGGMYTTEQIYYKVKYNEFRQVIERNFAVFDEHINYGGHLLTGVKIPITKKLAILGEVRQTYLKLSHKYLDKIDAFGLTYGFGLQYTTPLE